MLSRRLRRSCAHHCAVQPLYYGTVSWLLHWFYSYTEEIKVFTNSRFDHNFWEEHIGAMLSHTLTRNAFALALPKLCTLCSSVLYTVLWLLHWIYFYWEDQCYYYYYLQYNFDIQNRLMWLTFLVDGTSPTSTGNKSMLTDTQGLIKSKYLGKKFTEEARMSQQAPIDNVFRTAPLKLCRLCSSLCTTPFCGSCIPFFSTSKYTIKIEFPILYSV